jgi:cobalamin synthase
VLHWRNSSHQGRGSKLAAAVGADGKGKASAVMLAAAVLLAWAAPWISAALYVAVAAMWLVPDPRIERRLASEEHERSA